MNQEGPRQTICRHLDLAASCLQDCEIRTFLVVLLQSPERTETRGVSETPPWSRQLGVVNMAHMIYTSKSQGTPEVRIEQHQHRSGLGSLGATELDHLIPKPCRIPGLVVSRGEFSRDCLCPISCTLHSPGSRSCCWGVGEASGT